MLHTKSTRNLKRLIAVALVIIGAVTLYAWQIEPRWLQIREIAVELNIPYEFDGYTIAQISDIHASPDLPPRQLERAIAKISQFHPDILVVTGDWVSYRAEYAQEPAQIVSTAQTNSGIYGILGNHDHWTNADTVARLVEEVGIKLLRNQSVKVERNGAAIYLAGIDDIWEEQHDLHTALRDVPADASVILLAHEPDIADEIAEESRVVFQLSGHSHGGQVSPPLIGPLILPYLAQKYPAGLAQVGGLLVYTNRGLGNMRPLVRFNCRPEITLITLHSRK
ncbi:MAG: metallophosphoesterase [Chloroflexota bacterium]